MIAMPSIAMISLMAMLSMFAATILWKRWMQWVALGCAVFEVACVAFLIFVVAS